MKDGDWWFEHRVLASGDDPSEKLSKAFDSKSPPSVFISGDGHREPAFKWATRGVWAKLFDDLVKQNKVCCHVERFPENVNAGCIPLEFAPVLQNNKVWGWELSVFKPIKLILETILELLVELKTEAPLRMSDVRYLTKEMHRVHDLGFMQSEGRIAMAFWDNARMLHKDPVTLPGFGTFCVLYRDRAMQLRTDSHPVVARSLQRLIDQYADHAHLISVGNAHLLDNSLHRYLQPPKGTFGVADPDSFQGV